MCRHLAYLGTPVSLARILLDPENSLLQQSWAPRDMRGSGTVNADGFGVGWYDESGGSVRYRRSVPMWADPSFADLAQSVSTQAFLAAVRNGTTGMPITESACAPFREGQWLFSHNGVVTGWPQSLSGLAGGLDTTDLMTLDAPTDSAVLWALLRRRLLEGDDLVESVENLTNAVARAAPESLVNLLAMDGETIVASTFGHSLSVLREADGVVVSSEPFGEPNKDWQVVPDRHLVIATASSLKIQPLHTKGPHR